MDDLATGMRLGARDPAKRRRSAALIAWVIAALVLVIVGAVVSLALRTPPPLLRFRAPSGQVVRVEAVRVGANQHLVIGNGLQRTLSEHLSPALQGWLGASEVHYTPSDPAHPVVWASCATRGTGSGLWGLFVEVVDERGRGVERVIQPSTLQWPAGGGEVAAWELPIFPRRQRDLRVRMHAYSATGARLLLGELTVPNPAPGPYPAWTAAPLPATRKSGSLTFTLDALESGLDARDLNRHAGPGDFAWSRLRFHTSEPGRASSWRLFRVRAADPTGNRWETTYTTPARDALHRTWWGFNAGFQSDEPAYKLELEVARRDGFSPDELWTVRGVRLPRQGQVTYVKQSAARQGIRLEFRGIAGQMTTMPGDGISTAYPSSVPVSWGHLRIRNRPSDAQVNVIRAVDDRGRVFTAHIQSRSRDDLLMEVNGPRDAKTMDLTFAIHRSRTVRFLAHAADASTQR